jgi:hypothetical protein
MYCTMHISLPWAVALLTAGILLVVVLLGLAVRVGRIRATARPLDQLAHMLGGGLIGFMALAFPPAWPVLAFMATVLVGSALRQGRTARVGMLATGFGVPWVLLTGAGIMGDLVDPAVIGSPGTVYWFGFGAIVLGIGLGLLISGAVRR